MVSQSTRHLMVMEPLGFLSNPQTRETNTYQADNPPDATWINSAAVREFRTFRDHLVDKGVIMTSVVGQAASPDDVFCNNWVSTHRDAEGRGKMVLYPMLADNRRIERRPELLTMLGRSYDVALDLSAEEEAGRFLESTGSLGLDRVHRVAYIARSARTDESLARRWCDAMGFTPVFFDTRNHVGKPVYHTDVLMFIGSSLIGICTEAIVPEDRGRVMDQIRATHTLMELSMDQMRSFCGNALEVRGHSDRRHLVMSARAGGALSGVQQDLIATHFDGGLITAPLDTIETYGGGSARCMLLELH